MRVSKSKIAGAASAIIATLLIVSGCGGSSSESSSSSDVRVIQAITSGGPAPYIFTDDKGNITGQNYDLVAAIFKELPQYKVEYSKADFSAIFGGLDSGRYQLGVNNLSWNKERAQKYLYSDPIYNVQYYVEVPENSTIGNTPIKSFADLAGKTALLDPGVNATTAIEKWNASNPDKAIKTKYVGTGSDMTTKLRQIESGQADFAFDDIPIFNYYKKKVGLSLKGVPVGDGVNKQLGNNNAAYLVFPKGEKKLRDDVNTALKKVIENGTSKKINEKWYGIDLSPKI